MPWSLRGEASRRRVSVLWEPVDGPAKGIPFVVFAGNVGNDESLFDVVRKLSNTL